MYVWKYGCVRLFFCLVLQVHLHRRPKLWSVPGERQRRGWKRRRPFVLGATGRDSRQSTDQTWCWSVRCERSSNLCCIFTICNTMSTFTCRYRMLYSKSKRQDHPKFYHLVKKQQLWANEPINPFSRCWLYTFIVTRARPGCDTAEEDWLYWDTEDKCVHMWQKLTL